MAAACALVVIIYGLIVFKPIPSMIYIPLVLSVMPLAAPTLKWARPLQVIAWLGLTFTALTFGALTVPSWLFMGIAIGISSLKTDKIPV